MHKKIIAAASAAAAVAMPMAAQAQSNVTIYGLIDVNVAFEKAGDLKHRGVGQGELNGNRWGLKGTEDLGDGLKAIFILESGFDPSNGMSEQGGRLFGRQALVGLESGNWGTVTLGRQYSPAFSAIDPYEATGGSDHSVGLLSRKTGGVKPAYEVRFDNMVRYRSPVVAGFSADAAYWFGENTSADSTAQRLGDGWGLAGKYANGPFSTSLVTQRVQRDVSGGKVRTDGIALSYDFGPVKAYAAYTRDKETGTQGDGKARTYVLSAEVPVSPAGTVAVAYGNRNESDDPAAEDARGWSAYYMHGLSKRTTLYVGYSTLTNKDGANYAIGSNMTPAAGDDQRAVLAGVRHKF